MTDNFQKDQTYTREQVEAILGCDGKGYLPMRAGKVVCGFFTLRYNPEAPHVLLPGRDGGRERCAAVFCDQSFGVPIFIKEPSNYVWKYVGDYQAESWSEKAADIAEQNRRANRRDITRVIYLKPAEINQPVVEVDEHLPSPYQQAIYNFQEQGEGDLFVNAVAGSGKTATLLGLGRRLPQELHRKALFVAFNKSIANKLEATLPTTLKASTLHSVGYTFLRRAAEDATPTKTSTVLDTKKYSSLVSHCIPGADQNKELADDVTKLVHFTMMTLTDPHDRSALEELALKYDIGIEDWPKVLRGVAKVISRGAAEWKKSLSFDDMVYLPNILDIPFRQYQMIYCDEAQDLSKAQLGLLLRLRAPGGRIVFVGDRDQAVFGFAGADTDSVDNILAATNAHQLPLNVCYRCPTSHLEQAQLLVPAIQPREDAPVGILTHISEDDLFLNPDCRVKAGDMMICRVSAPIVDMALRLQAAHVPAKVRGLDIAESWITITDEVVRAGWTNFLSALEAYALRKMAALHAVKASDLEKDALSDRVRGIRRIYNQVLKEDPEATASDLRTAIKNLFTDVAENSDAVLLSTVHRAKGLESERVYILKEELMPHPKASTEEEKRQEKNLRYVALTRAKNALYFVDSKPNA